jgi:TRAP transporter TAXI family solute receptor
MNSDARAIRRRSLLSLPVLLLTSVAPLTRAQGVTSTVLQRPILLGTSTLGGGFALYGETVEAVLNRRAGRMLLKARATRGTTENIRMLERGDLDAALIQGTSASEVFERGIAESRLRILFAMYPSPGMMAVPSASSARRLDDLVGQQVVFGVRTSGLVTLARQVFSGIGRDIDRDFHAIYVEQAAESPQIVIDGRACRSQRAPIPASTRRWQQSGPST